MSIYHLAKFSREHSYVAPGRRLNPMVAAAKKEAHRRNDEEVMEEIIEILDETSDRREVIEERIAALQQEERDMREYLVRVNLAENYAQHSGNFIPLMTLLGRYTPTPDDIKNRRDVIPEVFGSSTEDSHPPISYSDESSTDK